MKLGEVRVIDHDAGTGDDPRRERFIAVDPGVTTGVVAVSLPANWRSLDLYSTLSALRSGEMGLSSCRQMELSGSETGQIDRLEALIFGRKGDPNWVKCVVVEDFILRLRTQSRDLLAPVRLSARLEDRLYKGGFSGQIVYQSPSDAKSIVTDLRLKQWGLWHPGSPHIRDAWRHMAKYLREQRGRPGA